MLRDPDEDQSDSGYSSNGCPKTPPWQYSERNHLSVLIQTPNADLSQLPAEGVVALVQAVGDALEQKHSREELARCCAKVMEMLQPAVVSGYHTKCMLMSLQLFRNSRLMLSRTRDAMAQIVPHATGVNCCAMRHCPGTSRASWPVSACMSPTILQSILIPLESQMDILASICNF